VRRSPSVLCVFCVMCTAVACASPPPGTIGAILARDASGHTYVREVPEQLAAYDAGIRPGDELLFVDGQEAQSLSDRELQGLLGGVVGQEVQLTLVRNHSQVIRVTVARSKAQRYKSPSP
jgi:C-terminal processing protease CtpA/Prc